MRARLARPRQSTRGRLVAPVATAAAVALVGGAVVATSDAPTVRGDVQNASVAGSSAGADAEAGAVVSYSFDLAAYVEEHFGAEASIVAVTDLPDGLTWDGGGVVSGDIAPGEYSFTVTVERGDGDEEFEVPITVGQVSGSSAVAEGGLGGEAQAGGQVTTGSAGADAILGAVAELVTGSTGGGETVPEAETPGGPLGSLATGQIDLGSLGGAETTPDGPESPSGSLDIPGSSTTVEGGTGGETELEVGGEAGSTGSTGGGETTGGGEIAIPGSTTSGDTGSLGGLAPGLAVTGVTLLGLAGLSIALGGGSSTPGSTALLPALPGSTAGGGSSENGSGGSVAPTVAAGAPSPTTVQAPGPTVANGRG